MKRLFLFAFLLSSLAVWSQKRAVILTAGQSNADGRVPMNELPAYITPDSYRYCQWSYGSGDFLKATGEFKPFWPTVARKALNDRWGFDAIVYEQLNKRLQQPFYVIKHTMGGTAIDTTCARSTHKQYWSADAAYLQRTRSASRKGKSLLKAFIEQIDDCVDGQLSQLKEGYDIKALLWHQGESDMPAAERYEDNFKAVISYIRQHLADKTGEKKYLQLPIICGTFAANSRQASPVVADAMRRIARDDKNVFVVDASDLSLQSDQIHFDAKGAETLGKRYYEVLERVAFPAIGDAFKGFWPVTDPKMKKSLNGTWDLKVVKGIDGRHEVPQKDHSWGRIPVPGCWEAYGFCKPSYSFPDSLTGYYRTEFNIPAEWKGQHVIIRLDGVLRGYDLWLNEQMVGSWEQAYNTCLFDLTPYLTKKAFKGEPQRLAMRIYSRFKGHEFDNFDDWAPMGIFRDVTLFTAPKTHLSDLTVTTKANGEVTVKTEVANPTKNTTTSYEILDAYDNVVSTGAKIENPQLWTAETPYLYTLRVYVKEKGQTLQTFTQKIGIREVSIDGNVLKVNGKPIKLRGVTCHSTDPKTVKVISDELTLKDMRLMKEASINYIRTSHYPREPRFFELADSLGFYVVCEAPFGSRGEKHLKKPDYFDILRTRVKATIDCHKNHPAVIVWSLGNENPLPRSCEKVGEYAQQLDSTRPYCFPQKGSTFRGIGFERFPKQVPIYAPHYPTTSQLRDFYTKTDRPLIFTEYCHTLGISFEDHDRQWEIIERTPGIAGGSVWEWVDQGMPFKGKKDEVGGKMYGYEEKVYTSKDGGFEMNGNQGTDGLLYADRTPLPNYYELQHNYAQACVIDTIFSGALHIRNRYDFINLKDNVTFHWTLTADRDTLATGMLSPDCAPHTTVACPLQLPELPQNKLILLNIVIKNKDGMTLLRQSLKLQDAPLAVKNLSVDVNGLIQEGPLVRVGRKMTMAEKLRVADTRIERYLQPLDNAYVKGSVTKTANRVDYVLTPDTTTNHFLAEVGVAYLLDSSIDRVQWVGMGPFATYPGRYQANRYGIWSMHKDDLYFEGNRRGVDAVWLSDKNGNGIFMKCNDGNVSFEQTDRGIVVTINAAVSGQGPKFSKTAFGVWSNKMGTKKGHFDIYRTKAGDLPLPQFHHPQDTGKQFRPFQTQYDTYLMRFSDITP